MYRRSLCALALVSLGVCSLVASLSLRPAGRAVRTEDRNGDGRPDVWRVYDTHGQLLERTIDANFDGRSDIHEYYAHGALARRESARHFDDRIDLVEDFDPSTHERIRSLVDVDEDGAANLLVLFQAGRPVFSKYATLPLPLASARWSPERRDRLADALRPLADPFSGDTAIGLVRLAPVGDAGQAAAISAGVPVAPRVIPHAVLPAGIVSGLDAHGCSLVFIARPAPRGPPLAS